MMHATQFDPMFDTNTLEGKYTLAYANALREERFRFDVEAIASAQDGLYTYVGTPEANAHRRALLTLQDHVEGHLEPSFDGVRAKHVFNLSVRAFAQAVGL